MYFLSINIMIHRYRKATEIIDEKNKVFLKHLFTGSIFLNHRIVQQGWRKRGGMGAHAPPPPPDFKKQHSSSSLFLLPKVIIQVQNGNGALKRLVSCFTLGK